MTEVMFKGRIEWDGYQMSVIDVVTGEDILWPMLGPFNGKNMMMTVEVEE